MNERQPLKEDKTEVSIWTIYSLYEHFTTLLHEMDLRYSQRYEDQEKAVDLALKTRVRKLDIAFRNHEQLTAAQLQGIIQKAEISHELIANQVKSVREESIEMTNGLRSQGEITATALREYTKLMQETAEKASDLRLKAQTDLMNAHLEAAKQAIAKVEASTEKRFESVNEFRGQLSDQSKTFIQRSEALQVAGSNSEKIDDLKGRMDRLEGRSSGNSASWTVLIQIVALAASLIAIFFALSK